jgi:hypothetical protein
MRPTAWEYYASRRRNPRASDASPFNQTGPVKLTLFVHNSADQVSSQQNSGPHQDNAERIVGGNFEHCSLLTKTTPGGLATHWGLGRGLGTQYKDARPRSPKALAMPINHSFRSLTLQGRKLRCLPMFADACVDRWGQPVPVCRGRRLSDDRGD